MPVLFKKRDKQNSNAYLLMILYKTLIRWRNTKHKSKKYSRHRYIHLKKIESERYEVFIFLYSNSLPRYLFLLQKKRNKVRSRHHVQKCICNATPSTRKPPSLSLIQQKSCWSFTTCRDETPRKQQIAGIICGAYDSSRRIYVKWNPSSG